MTTAELRAVTNLPTIISLATVAVLSLGSTTLSADTLADVQKNGFVKCGVDGGLPGFSEVGSDGVYKGIDVDLCRAVAAAVFGDSKKVKYVALNAKERLTALQSGEIDMLSRNTTWTFTRDNSLGLNYAGVNYYDGQGFMVNKKLGVKSAKELDGASICLQTGTTTELNVADYFRTNKMKYKLVSYDTNDQVLKGYETGRCDVLTSDQSQLYGLRIKLAKPDESIVLPEVISKEPLGPVVRQGDDKWFDIVKWTLFGLLNAEEAGVTSANVDAMLKTDNPDIKRLLGVEGQLGEQLSLKKDFMVPVIKQVGNYGESFERTVGLGSPLKIARGYNALWNKGGIQYAPPFR